MSKIYGILESEMHGKHGQFKDYRKVKYRRKNSRKHGFTLELGMAQELEVKRITGQGEAR